MTRCSECILLISQGVPVFPEIQGDDHMLGSSPQTPASTHNNAYVTVVAELNMLFRNTTQDICCSETRHKIYVVQKQDTRCMLFRNKTQYCFK